MPPFPTTENYFQLSFLFLKKQSIVIALSSPLLQVPNDKFSNTPKTARLVKELFIIIFRIFQIEVVYSKLEY